MIPKISVITPIYKTEQYLDKCLTSLVNQTLPDIEFVWVDNGASDECRNIIAKYAGKRSQIKVLQLPQNKGYGGAMNAGLDVATGDYIGFCDSDDWVDTDYFEKLYNAAAQNNADMAFTEYLLEYPDKQKKSEHITNLQIAESISEKVNVLKDGAIWDKIFKRSLLNDNNIRFPEHSKSYFEDNVLLFPAAMRSNKIVLINTTNYHYWQRETSVVHDVQHYDEMNSYCVEVINKLLDFTSEQNCTAAEKQDIVNFFSRSFPWQSILKKRCLYNRLIANIKDKDILLRIKAEKKKYVPDFIGRIFSIVKNPKGKTLYLLGFKFKISCKRR